jgi:hypothetical protein
MRHLLHRLSHWLGINEGHVVAEVRSNGFYVGHQCRTCRDVTLWERAGAETTVNA